MFSRVHRPGGIAVVGLFFLVACAETGPVGPADAPQFSASPGPVLVECPTTDSDWVEADIGSNGGELRLRNHRLQVGKQAVKGPNRFRLTDPASQYMELNVRGNDNESFGFDKPVQLTIDYSRCTRSNIDKAPLSVWKIDPETKALLKYMGGTDDKVARTITFTTDSLSAYSIAQ